MRRFSTIAGLLAASAVVLTIMWRPYGAGAQQPARRPAERPAPIEMGRPSAGERPAPIEMGRPSAGERPAPIEMGRPSAGERPAPIEMGRPAASAPTPPAGLSCGAVPADMVCVPGGIFKMGSTFGDDDELPPHQVAVSTFFLDRHEVSFGDYMQCVQAQSCEAPRYYPPLKQRKATREREEVIKRIPPRGVGGSGGGKSGGKSGGGSGSGGASGGGSGGKEGGSASSEGEGARPAEGSGGVKVKVADIHVDARLPVAGVTWEDAKSYCEYRKKHLPTEAQWEYAARGSRGNYYAWGGASPSCDRVASEKCGGLPKPVTSLPGGKSPFGALHMTGNVWEWVHDWYDPGYYATSANTADPTGPVNTQDPKTGKWIYRHRALRGGSWSGIPAELRTTYRFRLLPQMYANDVGFRCARSAVTLGEDVAAPREAPAAGPGGDSSEKP